MDRKVTIFLLIAMAGLSLASYISITTSVSVETIVRNDSTNVGVKLLNKGDEPAYDVGLALMLPDGFDANELEPGTLDPNEPYANNFTIKIDGGITPGTYPLVILTDYRDANSYPFSSINVNSLNVKEKTSSDIFSFLSGIKMTPDSSVSTNLSIMNRGEGTHDLKVTLFLPRELTVSSDGYDLTIGPKAREGIGFKISSFGALTGSTYVIFATVEYEEDGLHYTSTAGGTVEIVTEDELPPGNGNNGNPLDFLAGFDLALWLLIISFLLLIVAFVALSMKNKNEKRRKDISDNTDPERGKKPPQGSQGAS